MSTSADDKTYADEFGVNRYWWGPTRTCAYALALGDVAFADFNLTDDGVLLIIRISFDGYGCCTPDPADIRPMQIDDSAELIGRMGDDELLNTGVVRAILRRYFEAHRNIIWEDALVEWGLVSGT